MGESRATLNPTAEEAHMPTTKKAKTAPSTTTKKQAKPKAAKKAKTPSAAPPATPIDWSHAIAKAAEQKRSQANWPGSGQSWKKKVRI